MSAALQPDSVGKDVNVRVSVCVWRTNTESRMLERRMWQKKEKDSDKREWATLERAEGKEKGEERNADRELKKSDCTMVCPRQMVGCWGMKEKEAVGNDVSLSSFQAERNYQTSISSFGESNQLYCLLSNKPSSAVIMHYQAMFPLPSL